MKNKIINIALALAMGFLIYIAIATNNPKDTIDALSGATPSNEVIDAISSASEYEEDDD